MAAGQEEPPPRRPPRRQRPHGGSRLPRTGSAGCTEAQAAPAPRSAPAHGAEPAPRAPAAEPVAAAEPRRSLGRPLAAAEAPSAPRPPAHRSCRGTRSSCRRLGRRPAAPRPGNNPFTAQPGRCPVRLRRGRATTRSPRAWHAASAGRPRSRYRVPAARPGAGRPRQPGPDARAAQPSAASRCARRPVPQVGSAPVVPAVAVPAVPVVAAVTPVVPVAAVAPRWRWRRIRRSSWWRWRRARWSGRTAGRVRTWWRQVARSQVAQAAAPRARQPAGADASVVFRFPEATARSSVCRVARR